MGFGQHQSFYLREGWLYKGLEIVNLDKFQLHKSDAFEKMGIGKNMLSALQFWLVATEVLTFDVKEKSYAMTDFGQTIFEYDATLNMPLTRAMIHYKLASNTEIVDLNGRRSAAVIYWFFNELDGNIFDKEFLLKRYIEWVAKYKDISENSLKRDINVLTQMYDMEGSYEDPEDVLHSPLSQLELVSRQTDIIKVEGKIENITEEAVYYNILDYLISRELDSLTLGELVNSPLLPGRIFNLKQDELLKVIFSLKKKNLIEFTQTNNLDTLRVHNYPENINDILKTYYQESGELSESVI